MYSMYIYTYLYYLYYIILVTYIIILIILLTILYMHIYIYDYLYIMYRLTTWCIITEKSQKKFLEPKPLRTKIKNSVELQIN